MDKVIRRFVVQLLNTVVTRKFENEKRSVKRSVQTRLADGKAEQSGGVVMVDHLNFIIHFKIRVANRLFDRFRTFRRTSLPKYTVKGR